MIKIIAATLFAIEENNVVLDKINPELEKFLNYPFKNGGLKYDVQNKLGRAILNEIININDFRKNLLEELPQNNEENRKEANKKLFELLNSEIILDASMISLSKIELEDCSSFNFTLLDRFIADDRT